MPVTAAKFDRSAPPANRPCGCDVVDREFGIGVRVVAARHIVSLEPFASLPPIVAAAAIGATLQPYLTEPLATTSSLLKGRSGVRLRHGSSSSDSETLTPRDR